MRQTKSRHVIALLLLLSALQPGLAQPIDQLPMYGGVDRSTDPALRAADEKLVNDSVGHYGSREKASASFVGNGFAFYGRDDLTNAMRRFNQAWLLDPKNPEAYFGFAVVLHDMGKNCEATAQFEKAASFGRYVQGMAPDAGRVFVLCAIEDKSITEEARLALFARSDAFYAEALINEPNKGYVFASQATALFWRGKYSESWEAVKQARANGGRLPERFMQMLSAKLPEPQ